MSILTWHVNMCALIDSLFQLIYPRDVSASPEYSLGIYDCGNVIVWLVTIRHKCILFLITIW